MAQEYTMLHDIVSSHTQRMQNLKRYYPFFKLQENTLAQYRDGKFADLDMGYISLAVLRFFIEENHFNEKNVTYAMYDDFMHDFLAREYFFEETYGGAATDKGTPGDVDDLIQYIFDKLCNDGRPFVYKYYDPKLRTDVAARVKLIDSRFENNELVYFITGDAIEFYLDTKEVQEESKITAEQILLEKMLRVRNFKGGLEVIRRINSEVGRLIAWKDEVLRIFHHNVFEGAKALETFLQDGLAWFSEEQKLFASNRELLDKALVMAEQGGRPSDDIYALDRELKRAIARHSELLEASTSLQIQADELIQQAKRSCFRNVFSFDDFLEKMVDKDDISPLAAFVKPLFDMQIRQTLNLGQLDDLLCDKPEAGEETEHIGAGKEQMYVYDDELEEVRIGTNFNGFLKVLFEELVRRGRFDLKFLTHMYQMKYTEDIIKNGDYYAFIVHLSQKNHYDLKTIRENQDTFLEGMMADYLEKHEGHEFDGLVFDLSFAPNEKLTLTEVFEISNIYFTRSEE